MSIIEMPCSVARVSTAALIESAPTIQLRKQLRKHHTVQKASHSSESIIELAAYQHRMQSFEYSQINGCVIVSPRVYHQSHCSQIQNQPEEGHMSDLRIRSISS